MMTERARVVGLEGETAIVEVSVKSACGACEHGGGCGVSKLGKLVRPRPARWTWNSSAAASADLAKKLNCAGCHTPDKKLVGPSYKDIAAKYKGDAKAEARLFDRVKKGTGATGGEIWKMGSPMPPNSAVKDEDIKTLVKWILAGAPAK